ncbi:hypothetical protein Dda_2052 [Drechslerella dactyloides]|uniref:Uncharacterized protein n=1 Tax=Drechslerella dactyloides TaxID=74499 RepID=A0AAD6J2T4_DREDA|nr:hypothetical protein Dda_2052 [Drechslerella dactyloides]
MSRKDVGDVEDVELWELKLAENFAGQKATRKCVAISSGCPPVQHINTKRTIAADGRKKQKSNFIHFAMLVLLLASLPPFFHSIHPSPVSPASFNRSSNPSRR